MLWQEGEKERNSLSNSQIKKSWTIEDDSDNFVLNAGDHQDDEELEEVLVNEAEEIIDQAKLEAKKILEFSYREGYEKGYKEGYASGFSVGESAGMKKTDEAYQQVLELLHNTEKCRREQLLASEDDLRKLAVCIAEKIINTQLVLDEQSIVQITKTALNALVNPKYINVYVNPRDGEHLIKNKKILTDEITGEIPIKVIKNIDLPPGQCYLETDKGTLDASVSTQVLEIKKVLDIA